MTGKTTINWNSWEFSLIASMVDDLNVWGSKILGRGQGKGSQMRSWLNSTIHIRISYPIQLGKIWMDDDKKASSFCSVPKSCFSFWYNVEIYFVCVFLLPWQNPQKTVSNTFFDTKIKTLAVGEIHFPSEFFSALPYNGCQFVFWDRQMHMRKPRPPSAPNKIWPCEGTYLATLLLSTSFIKFSFWRNLAKTS